MEYEIIKNPMGMVRFSLQKGESVTAEAAALVYMKGEIETNTRMRKSGFLKSLKVAAFGGESFFVNEFIAHQDNCELGLTGNMLGDIEMINVDEELIVQSSAFVCSTSGLTLDTKWQGFTKGIFGTNLFMLKTIGTGDIFVNGWGGIISSKLESEEKMILDNYQLVALSSTANYRVITHEGIKNTIFGGEALLLEVTGPGTVYMQTKNFMEFVRAIIPYLPKRS